MVTTFANMKYVAYLRVSTKQQGESGLGLEAQQSIVNHYYSPEETFIEVKSGSNIKARPELAKAINQLAADLAHSLRSRQQWIIDISHELRTPLTILSGELAALQEGIRPLSMQHIDSYVYLFDFRVI